MARRGRSGGTGLVGSLARLGLRIVSDGVGGPQSQVVPEQLHDEGRILVRVLVERIQLSDGVIEGLQVARLD